MLMELVVCIQLPLGFEGLRYTKLQPDQSLRLDKWQPESQSEKNVGMSELERKALIVGTMSAATKCCSRRPVSTQRTVGIR
jgi:hypothetical protein